jgi:LysR family transcriptional regulator, hydrogen peroxide-inducible genes activator
MEITQLRYFVAVVEAQNFTRAAEKCNITQPSLSQQIINLERELGQRLFHRLGRKAVPTEAGNAFLQRAKGILRDIEDAAREMGDHSGQGRRIAIGAVQTVMPYLISDLVIQCRTSHPQLAIDAHEGFRADLVRGVLEGTLDLAVVPLPVKDRQLAIEPLLSEPLLLAVGRDHPFASQPEIDIRAIAGETFVGLGDSSALAAQVRAFFGDQKLEPRIGIRCTQVATLKRFVAAGLGISLLPQLARHEEDRESLVYLRLSGDEPRRELVVVRHLQRYQTRGAEEFLRLLREHVRSRFPASVDET